MGVMSCFVSVGVGVEGLLELCFFLLFSFFIFFFEDLLVGWGRNAGG